MLESIMSGIWNILKQFLSFALDLCMEPLSFNLNDFTTRFPHAAAFYTILQSVGVGLVVAIALWALFKFLFPSVNSQERETPWRVLISSAIAVILIFFGNYILEFVMNLFSYPYKEMMDQQIVGSGASIGDAIVQGVEGSVSGVGTMAKLGIFLFEIVLSVMLAFQVIKVVLEVIERWLVLNVVVYTSPLAWATMASVNTQELFKKWINLFITQCIMMLLNIWSVKLVLDILTNGDADITGVIVAIAFCRVAKQLDSIVRSIGLNPYVTAGSILDDMKSGIVSAAMAWRGVKGAASGMIGAANTVRQGAAYHLGGGTTGHPFFSKTNPNYTAGATNRHDNAQQTRADLSNMTTGQRIAANALTPLQMANARRQTSRDAQSNPGQFLENGKAVSPERAQELNKMLTRGQGLPTGVRQLENSPDKLSKAQKDAHLNDILKGNNVSVGKNGALQGTADNIQKTIQDGASLFNGSSYEKAALATVGAMGAKEAAAMLNNGGVNNDRINNALASKVADEGLKNLNNNATQNQAAMDKYNSILNRNGNGETNASRAAAAEYARQTWGVSDPANATSTSARGMQAQMQQAYAQYGMEQNRLGTAQSAGIAQGAYNKGLDQANSIINSAAKSIDPNASKDEKTRAMDSALKQAGASLDSSFLTNNGIHASSQQYADAAKQIYNNAKENGASKEALDEFAQNNLGVSSSRMSSLDGNNTNLRATMADKQLDNARAEYDNIRSRTVDPNGNGYTDVNGNLAGEKAAMLYAMSATNGASTSLGDDANITGRDIVGAADSHKDGYRPTFAGAEFDSTSPTVSHIHNDNGILYGDVTKPVVDNTGHPMIDGSGNPMTVSGNDRVIGMTEDAYNTGVSNGSVNADEFTRVKMDDGSTMYMSNNLSTPEVTAYDNVVNTTGHGGTPDASSVDPSLGYNATWTHSGSRENNDTHTDTPDVNVEHRDGNIQNNHYETTPTNGDRQTDPTITIDDRRSQEQMTRASSDARNKNLSDIDQAEAEAKDNAKKNANYTGSDTTGNTAKSKRARKKSH